MKQFLTKLTTNILLGCLLVGGIGDLSDPNLIQVSPPETLQPTETFRPETDLIIKAINPGYTIDGVRDVGELIELQKLTDTSLSLAGYTLRYVNSSEKTATLISFSEGSSMVGEFLLLRLARTADSAEAEATYTTTIAMGTGKLELAYNDTVVDQVCWSNADSCAASFDSKQPTFLVRDVATGVFEHLENYEVHYNAETPAVIWPVSAEPPEEPSAASDNNGDAGAEALSPQCRGLEFSEILSYYADDKSEQFIEFYNPTDKTITLTGCSLRYKKKLYPLTGEILPDAYEIFYPAKAEPPFTVTKNPSSSNTIELIDADETIVDILTYNHGQKKSVAWAKFYEADGSEFWMPTYALTPGKENVYQEFRTCPAGKVINPLTGNCIKSSATTTNQETACPEGKVRNPLTGRCKKVEATSEPKSCAEGYERNPETNRCRKIKKTNTGADYALVPATYADEKAFTAVSIVLGLVVIGLAYIVLQFRRDIARLFRKIRQRLHNIRKNLVARGFSLHRNKKT